MLEDQNVAEEAEEEVSGATNVRKLPRPTPRDLRLIREWKPEEAGDRIDPEKLAAVLAFLPEAEHETTRREIRTALGLYLHRRSLERRPDPAMRAAQWRAIGSACRAARRALLAHPDPPAGTPVPEVLIQDAQRAHQMVLSKEVLGTLSEYLRRVEEYAPDCEAAAEGDAVMQAKARRDPRDGPARDVPMTELLRDLRPLWGPLKGSAKRAFVVVALAAIGEEWGEDAIRKRQERMDTA